jgi:hypothetical protein
MRSATGEPVSDNSRNASSRHVSGGSYVGDPNRALFESVVSLLAPVLDELVFVGVSMRVSGGGARRHRVPPRGARVRRRTLEDDHPGGRQVQIEDPDGNPIELFEPAQHRQAAMLRPLAIVLRGMPQQWQRRCPVGAGTPPTTEWPSGRCGQSPPGRLLSSSPAAWR